VFGEVSTGEAWFVMAGNRYYAEGSREDKIMQKTHLRSLVFIIGILLMTLTTVQTHAAKPISPTSNISAQSAEPMILSFTRGWVSCLSYNPCADYHWETANAVRVRIISGTVDPTTGKFIPGGWFNALVAPTGNYSDFLKIGNDTARLCIIEPKNAKGRNTCKVYRID
jgi:hypothetical protein